MTRTRISLVWKITLGFLLVAITTAGLIAVFIRLTTVNRLTNLIVDQQRGSLLVSVQDYYNENGSWTDIDKNWLQIRYRSVSTANPSLIATQTAERTTFRDRRRLFGLADAQGRVLVQLDSNYPKGSVLPADMINNGTPVMVNGQRVGTLINTPSLPGLSPEENLYLTHTNEALVYAVIGSMLVALIVALVLARTLIRPLRALTQAARNMTNGQFDQQVKVGSNDEVGQLAQAFNDMSQEVTRVNLLKRQMTADIAHDLRTPLTVIGGYVESMRDGVLQPTTERLSLIYTEIERLQNLVGDLKMLSLADAGELSLHQQLHDPKTLLEQAAAPFQHRAETQQIELSVEADADLPRVNVDDLRMMQVFHNLISNAIRYTPDGGKISLRARAENGSVVISVADNGSGIPTEDLPNIFDRFYRVDKSRNGNSGESGLGLAIVKALVEAQDGKIYAESELGKGTTISVHFPAQPA
ncbi:MAG TPA: ATP-binding protein [Anaerolineaceae bacterium]